eukprot:m.115440 g.115440  ORF g.115440 m.115440 type:complete len:235 (+) comp37544_c0_seq21:1001-1705(+)
MVGRGRVKRFSLSANLAMRDTCGPQSPAEQESMRADDCSVISSRTERGYQASSQIAAGPTLCRGRYVLSSSKRDKVGQRNTESPAWKPAGVSGLTDPSGSIRMVEKPVSARTATEAEEQSTGISLEQELLEEMGESDEATLDIDNDINDENQRVSSDKLFSWTRLDEAHYHRLSDTLNRQKEEDKELRYLEFVADLTDDILARGIYSNQLAVELYNLFLTRMLRGEKQNWRRES